ncbi:hypothetical protein MNR02_17595 (plasmid) [Shinella sp. H4-D48]|uniref:hypothetical protein n=1 Tax=Shinella sp. H4-D48 TaxID=2925841 RepID=UPI001F535B01|nr:hypothetical protein [Shinella sp. H4-D48]UNK40332.1 hypothetical protein MNR02_17595 [Shinella sp. H4-D48]
MRSTLKTIALAATALSLAAGGTFAASRPANPNPALQEHHRYDRSSGDHDSADDFMMPAQPTPVRMTPAMTYKPRLHQVLADVRSAEKSIRREEAMHKLSAGAAGRLEAEAQGIRQRAMAVADANHGTLPKANFQRLEASVRKLDRDIVRLS